jgi:hypothetical protein
MVMLMGRSWSAAVALTAATLAATFGALPASATGTVLTVGSPGGSPAQPGDILKAAGTATFLLNSSSTAGIRCRLTAQATVQTNPPAPGTAVTFLNGLPFTSCVSNLPSFVVDSVSADNLPYRASLASSLAVAVSGGPTGTPVQVTIIGDAGDLTVICAYRPDNGQIPGRYANSDNSISLGGVGFTQVSGSTLCPSPLLFTARVAPVVDSTRGSQFVFVN